MDIYAEAYRFLGDGENDCIVTFSAGKKIKVIKDNGLDSVYVYFCRISDKFIYDEPGKWRILFVQNTRTANHIVRLCIEISDDVEKPKMISSENYIGNHEFPDFLYHRTKVEFAGLVIEINGPGKTAKLSKLTKKETSKIPPLF